MPALTAIVQHFLLLLGCFAQRLICRHLTKKAQNMNEMGKAALGRGGRRSGSPPQWLSPTKEGAPSTQCSSVQ